ncbi:MAG: hypothetical protein LWW93_13255 [Hyphomicrobiales bacterium]|nr:hypothetical protein [Hyphomicrobiales bacterium]
MVATVIMVLLMEGILSLVSSSPWEQAPYQPQNRRKLRKSTSAAMKKFIEFLRIWMKSPRNSGKLRDDDRHHSDDGIHRFGADGGARASATTRIPRRPVERL